LFNFGGRFFYDSLKIYSENFEEKGGNQGRASASFAAFSKKIKMASICNCNIYFNHLLKW
jgi:hypothetical protein